MSCSSGRLTGSATASAHKARSGESFMATVSRAERLFTERGLLRRACRDLPRQHGGEGWFSSSIFMFHGVIKHVVQTSTRAHEIGQGRPRYPKREMLLRPTKHPRADPAASALPRAVRRLSHWAGGCRARRLFSEARISCVFRVLIIWVVIGGRRSDLQGHYLRDSYRVPFEGHCAERAKGFGFGWTQRFRG